LVSIEQRSQLAQEVTLLIGEPVTESYEGLQNLIGAMALSEVGRPLRFANVLLGGWLLLAPLVLTGYPGLGAAAGILAGILLIALALPRTPIKSHYGAWDQFILSNAAKRS
jgi:hypothetical protein